MDRESSKGPPFVITAAPCFCFAFKADGEAVCMREHLVCGWNTYLPSHAVSTLGKRMTTMPSTDNKATAFSKHTFRFMGIPSIL